MFERFTKDARKTVMTAQEEARRRSDARRHRASPSRGGRFRLRPVCPRSRPVARELDRLDSEGLKAVGIDPGLVDVETSHSQGSGMKHIPFTHAAKDISTGALKEAIALGHRHIGVEHIALALTRLPSSDRAVRTLAGRSVDPADLRRSVFEALRQAT